MSPNEEDPILLSIATTIADGHPVDWSGMRENYPDMEQYLESLRLLERIASGIAASPGSGQ